MAALYIVGAAASGPVTPIRDNARWQAGVEENQGTENNLDSASASYRSPLRDACTCRIEPGCVVCRRFDRQERIVRARRAFWLSMGVE